MSLNVRAAPHAKADIARARDLATFWHGGSLSALDLACLLSFTLHGFRVKVYSYEPLNLPAGLIQADAKDILESSFLNAFIVNNKASLSHFSDLFRYRLFQRTGEVWIDSDLLCLTDFVIPVRGPLLARETPTRLNGAILRLDSDDPSLSSIIKETERLAGVKNFKWGSTGPSLITNHLMKAVLDRSYSPGFFYPILWDAWWKPFLPSERAWCEGAAKGSYCLHLWNNIVESSGYWKDIAPPRGSYLYEQLAKLGLLHLFKATLPEIVMTRIVENDRNLDSARHLPLIKLILILGRRIKKRTTFRS